MAGGLKKKNVEELRTAGIINDNQYIDNSGYIHERKQSGYWPYAHVILWEKTNGPIPAGSFLKFINGDRRDLRLENLKLIIKNDDLTKLKKENDQLREEIKNLTELLVSDKNE
jgi:hypothetical protein